MRKVIKGLNDFESWCIENNRKDLLDEWDYKKNDELMPDNIAAHSGKKTWWKCSKGHEWQTQVAKRTTCNNGCPYCAGWQVLAGFNDLVTINPEIAKEWDYEKNGILKPIDVTFGSGKKVWWKCSKGHEWQTQINNRTIHNNGCPYCSNQKVLKGFNDLATTYPELCDEWNYKKNGTLKPTDVTFGSQKKVWWKCFKGHEWQAQVVNRTISNTSCPVCGNKKVLCGFNDLATTYPELCDEWDYKKNGALKPTDVTFGSGKKVWWKCRYGHKWQAQIVMRTTHNSGCPKCSDNGTSLPEQGVAYYLEKICKVEQRIKIDGKEVDVYLPEFKIGIEYDGCFYHKTADIPKEKEKDRILYNNGIRIIRIKESDSNLVENNIIFYKTDKMRANYEWAIKQLYELLFFFTDNTRFKSVDVNIQRDLINIRERFSLYNKDRSLSLVYPEIAKEWNYDKNGNLSPDMFSFGSGIKVWWKCQYGHEWQTEIVNRAVGGRGCPYCVGQRVITGANDLETIYPEVASEWHPTKNDNLKPSNVTSKSGKKVWWLGKCGHEWQAYIENRTVGGKGCPYCAGRSIIKGVNDLEAIYPEIASEWHPTKNGNLKPSDVTSKSGKKVWWKCSKGHEWQAVIYSRAKNVGCPYCNRNKKRVKNIDTGETFDSASEAARQYRMTGANISSCCRGVRQTAGGYHWEYV